MSECIIEFKDVSFSDEEKTYFKNLSLKIYEGDRLILKGYPGLGQDIFIKLISGDLKPDSGEVVVNGSVKNVSTQEDSRIWLWEENPDILLSTGTNVFPKKEEQQMFDDKFKEIFNSAKAVVVASYRNDITKMSNKFLHFDESKLEIRNSFRSEDNLDNMFYLSSINNT